MESAVPNRMTPQQVLWACHIRLALAHSSPGKDWSRLGEASWQNRKVAHSRTEANWSSLGETVGMSKMVLLVWARNTRVLLPQEVRLSSWAMRALYRLGPLLVLNRMTPQQVLWECHIRLARSSAGKDWSSLGEASGQVVQMESSLMGPAVLCRCLLAQGGVAHSGTDPDWSSSVETVGMRLVPPPRVRQSSWAVWRAVNRLGPLSLLLVAGNWAEMVNCMGFLMTRMELKH